MILSPLYKNLSPLGHSSRSPAAGGMGGIDEYTLALIRPVYSGGSWVIGDVSPYARTVTNSGLTSAAGPWGGGDTAILDPTQAAYGQLPASSDLAAGSIRWVDMWIRVDSAPPRGVAVLHLGPASAAYPYINIGVGPDGAGINVVVNSRPGSASTAYPASVGGLSCATWYRIDVAMPCGAGAISVAINGVWGATSAAHTPYWEDAPAVLIGRYLTIDTYYAGYGVYAEIRLSSVSRYTPGTDFDPPSGPYTE